jgi:hypothetical protein
MWYGKDDPPTVVARNNPGVPPEIADIILRKKWTGNDPVRHRSGTMSKPERA